MDLTINSKFMETNIMRNIWYGDASASYLLLSNILRAEGVDASLSPHHLIYFKAEVSIRPCQEISLQCHLLTADGLLNIRSSTSLGFSSSCSQEIKYFEQLYSLHFKQLVLKI